MYLIHSHYMHMIVTNNDKTLTLLQTDRASAAQSNNATHRAHYQCVMTDVCCVNKTIIGYLLTENITRKPSYRWQTRATWKSAKNCLNSTCLQRCRWRHWSIFIRLAVVASEICEISRNSLKIQTYGVQGHPRSSILVSMESPYVTSY